MKTRGQLCDINERADSPKNESAEGFQFRHYACYLVSVDDFVDSWPVLYVKEDRRNTFLDCWNVCECSSHYCNQLLVHLNQPFLFLRSDVGHLDVRNELGHVESKNPH